MRLRNIVRILVYSLAAVVVAAVTVLGLTIYLRGIHVPPSVLNARVAQSIASRYGLRYSLESLQIGCLGRDCPGEVNAGVLDIEIQIPEPLRIRLDETRSSRGNPVIVRGLELRSGDRPPMIGIDSLQSDLFNRHASVNGVHIGLLSTVDNVEFDGAAKQVTASGIRFSSVGVDTIQLQGWSSAPDNYIALKRMDVSGVHVGPFEGTAANSICAQLPSSADLGADAITPFRPLLPLLLKDIEILNGDLLRSALAIGVVILILKLLSVLWVRSWWVLVLAAIPAAAPFVLYFQFRQTLLAGALIIVAVAILLRVFVYGRGDRWYQRWEPFVVDIASVMVLLPLLGYGLQLPPFPTPPAGLQLDHIEVANVAGASSAAQYVLPQTSILGLRVALPGATPQIEVGVASILIPTTNIIAPPSSRVTINAMTIDGVNLAYDPDRREVGNIAARVRLAGLFESNVLERELRNIEFLRGIDARSRVGFDADVWASGPARPPEISAQFPRSKNLVSVRAAIALRPAECTAGFDVAARIQTAPLILTARADGDAESIHIRSVSSLPESPIQIASGNGTVALAGAPKISLNLGSIRGSSGSTRLDVDSLGIAASVPAPGKKGIQAASIAVGPMSIRTAPGMNIRAASSNIHFDRMPDRRSVPVTFETRIENVQLEGPDRRIAANFPSLVTRISGQTSAETIPRRFNGTFDFFASGSNPSDELIGTNRPVSFTADLWKGLFDIPEQTITFHEAVLSESQTEIPVQFKLSGRLSTIVPHVNADIETKTVLSHFEPAMGSARIALDDAHLSGRLNWDDQGSTAGLNYGIGSIRVGLSPGPSAVCLDEISTLNVSALGTISRIPESSGLPAMTQPPSPCVSLPSLPETIRFRLSGNYPVGAQESLLRLERENGTGFRIQNVGSEIRSLQIRDGRLVSIETNADIAGIGNLQGSGGIAVRANIRQSQDLLQLDTTLAAPDGTPLLEARVGSSPSRLTLDATQRVPADRILAVLKPFLSDMQVDLGNVNLQARLTQLHANANFENGVFLNADVEARLDRGDIASIASPELTATVSTSAAGTEPLFSLSIGRPSEPNGPRRIIVSAGVPAVMVHSVTDKHVALDVAADLSVIAQGSLHLSGLPAPSPILAKIFDVSSGLGRQSSQLVSVLNTGSARQPTNNLQWNVHLSQNSPANALLRLESETLEIHISEASFDAAWDGAAPPARSRIAVTTPFHSRIGLEGNAVLLDLLAPIAASYAMNDEPESRIDSNIPVQVIFAERLNPSTGNSESLWNRDYYAQFWRAHPPRFSATVFASPIDFNEVMLGPLSVRDVRFPLEPLRIVIGYSDALQVGLPFSGRALYGGVEGNFEASVTASNGVASLDTRLNLDLKNIQVGGIGSTMNGAHSAIVEDELDGKVSVRVDGLPLDRNTLPAFRAGRVSPSDLEKLGMSVHLLRSREAASLPGVFQASSDVQINLVNELLNQIVKDLRLPAPPRALTYRNLALDFDVERGRVRTDNEVFKLGGVQLYSSNTADVSAEVRAHLGRPGDRIMLGNLMEMLGSLGAAEAGGPNP